MKVTKEFHYLTRYKSEWQILCYSCLARYHAAVNGIEVISYSACYCQACGAKWKDLAPGLRSSAVKMKTVTYIIHASVPEWDQTSDESAV